jgi:hypothetical protein
MKYYYAVLKKDKKKIQNFIERINETKNRKYKPSYNSLGITSFIFGAYIINYYFIKI